MKTIMKKPTRRIQGCLIKAATISALALAMTPAYALVLDVTITADNSYSFGFGDESGMSSANFYGRVNNPLAGDIFGSNGPEYYTVDAGDNEYVYISVWSDSSSYQGLLANFSVNDEKLESMGVWEVFATGDNSRDAAVAYNLQNVNSAINQANTETGSANGSIGWVDESGSASTNGKLAIDENNNQYVVTPHQYGLAGLFDETDHWLYYDNGQNSDNNPFAYDISGNSSGWLVFRASLQEVTSQVQVPEPFTLSLFATGLIGLFSARRNRKKLHQ